MIFLSSLVFVLVLFVSPGEMLLVSMCRALPFVPFLASLIAVNLAVYALVWVGLRLGRKVLIDFDLAEETVGGLRLREWLDVSGCWWLNLVGLAAMGGGTFVLSSKGQLPAPCWFLFGAVVLGLWDVLKRRRLLSFPGELPAPRFSAEAIQLDSGGRPVEFNWSLWEEPSAGPGTLSATFTFNEEQYLAARGVERYARVPLENYTRYARERFTSSVQQVAAFFREHSRKHGFSAFLEMVNVVCFARSIRYARDEETRNVDDWANFAIETLYDSAGDCEDHAILAATLLHQLGHSVALFYLRLHDSGHIALGYECPEGGGPFFASGVDGRTYYYVETVPTDSVEQIGDLSSEFIASLKEWKVLPVSVSIHNLTKSTC